MKRIVLNQNVKALLGILISNVSQFASKYTISYALEILTQLIFLFHQFREFLLQFFPELFLFCESFLQLLELLTRKTHK